ncbi:MAG TPA: LysM peptidoglycan-binding domain-containing protein [Syntrophales bacterium]|jgi:nucleoid-associated protein YgaU|nr:LysM peptidoglycan-binding domain-containing protein [Syntrophales bacterium]HON23564.1 LysM peptidoglycan-binding domain-containing protein [Syntrophales bacterium]HOU76680.1 LysM peptidoglycan-binding domain-containing protein [Syntrophales bacterium]HPC31437.1 LysM peptidoglycan-binding domain-containing protein [Syntrophales bacterium]HQG33343.1 LysM peptidoglycan-binding domain-containing protein [Syntrophales bacterium]
MSKIKQGVVPGTIVISAIMIFSFAGCAKKAVTVGAAGTTAEQTTVSQQQRATPTGAGSVSATPGGDIAGAGRTAKTADGSAGAVTEYVVKKGENLWWIAKYKDIYNDPYLWPVIYKANKDQIKNPNRIYPGQRLKIPRSGLKETEIIKARKQAGAKKPYRPPQYSKPPVI